VSQQSAPWENDCRPIYRFCRPALDCPATHYPRRVARQRRAGAVYFIGQHARLSQVDEPRADIERAIAMKRFLLLPLSVTLTYVTVARGCGPRPTSIGFDGSAQDEACEDSGHARSNGDRDSKGGAAGATAVGTWAAMDRGSEQPGSLSLDGRVTLACLGLASGV
jgi:hypothetical protein